MTYSWQIVDFETVDEVNGDGVTLSDSVVRIQWIRTGTEGDKYASVVGFHKLTASAVAEADFVSFSDLTEAKVIEWLDAGISDELINSYNTKIQEKIERQGTTSRNIPWS
jgi:hypothetical protein